MKLAASLRPVLEFLAERPPPGADIATRREGFENVARRLGGSAKARIEPAMVGGVAGEWHIPEDAAPHAQILYLHGGAFALATPVTYRAFGGKLAELAQMRVFVVDYRRIPEDPFPAGLDDCTAVARALLDDASGKLLIAGDSAGGNLTFATTLRLRAVGARMPAALATISPWLDLTQSAPTFAERSHVDPFIAKAALDWASATYLAGRSPTDPFAAPIHADFTGFPPVWNAIGTCEVLLDDSRRLYARLKEQGVACEMVTGEGMIHIWPFFWPVLPEGLETLRALARFLRSALE